MQQEIRYRVCPHRNVPAAFQRFLGPDSGGLERFFPHQRMHRVDGTLLIVSGSMDALNAAFSGAWSSTASACWAFALGRGKDATSLIVQTATLLFGSRPGRAPA